MVIFGLLVAIRTHMSIPLPIMIVATSSIAIRVACIPYRKNGAVGALNPVQIYNCTELS